MNTKEIVPVILWDGDDELVSCQQWIERGDYDQGLLSLLENTAVYLDLLSRDPECSPLADPNQLRLVKRGHRSLMVRLGQVYGLQAAAIHLAKINLMILQCREQA